LRSILIWIALLKSCPALCKSPSIRVARKVCIIHAILLLALGSVVNVSFGADSTTGASGPNSKSDSEQASALQFLSTFKYAFDNFPAIEPIDLERRFGFRLFGWRENRLEDNQMSTQISRFNRDGTYSGFIFYFQCVGTKPPFGCNLFASSQVNDPKIAYALNRKAVMDVFGPSYKQTFSAVSHGHPTEVLTYKQLVRGIHVEAVFDFAYKVSLKGAIEPTPSIRELFIRTVLSEVKEN
jgi:hypothetical protein